MYYKWENQIKEENEQEEQDFEEEFEQDFEEEFGEDFEEQECELQESRKNKFMFYNEEQYPSNYKSKNKCKTSKLRKKEEEEYDYENMTSKQIIMEIKKQHEKQMMQMMQKSFQQQINRKDLVYWNSHEIKDNENNEIAEVKIYQFWIKEKKIEEEQFPDLEQSLKIKQKHKSRVCFEPTIKQQQQQNYYQNQKQNQQQNQQQNQNMKMSLFQKIQKKQLMKNTYI